MSDRWTTERLLEPRVKGRRLEEWEAWLRHELTPPITVDDETRYVLESFLELISHVAAQAHEIERLRREISAQGGC